MKLHHRRRNGNSTLGSIFFEAMRGSRFQTDSVKNTCKKTFFWQTVEDLANRQEANTPSFRSLANLYSVLPYKRMNICIVAPDKLIANKGGLESVCYNLALIFGRKEGIRCFQLFTKINDAPDIPGISYQIIPETYQQLLDKDVEETRRFIQENDIDILWNHSPSIHLSQYLKRSAAGTKTKIITIYHSSPYAKISEVQDRLALAFYRMRTYGETLNFVKTLLKFPLSLVNSYLKTRTEQRIALDNSHKYVLLSGNYVNEFLLLSGVTNRKKLTSITNPLLSHTSHKKNIYKKHDIILVVARLEWKNKRIDRLIRIWGKIEKSFPTWDLFILGAGPAYKDYVNLTCKMALRRVTFMGQVNPNPFYEKAKIICMTSTWEGLPMALLEAQQHGCVPICYESFSALPDIINNGETGYRIPAFKEKLYIEKLTDMMSDEQALQHMSENCREHAKNFDIEKIAETWISLFKETLNTPS